MSSIEDQIIEYLEAETTDSFINYCKENSCWTNLRFYTDKVSVLHLAACHIN